jgi:tetratricopeptide (TPR) repeat protein
MANFQWFSRGRYDLALQYNAQALAEDPVSLLTLTIRTAMLVDLGDLDGAQATRTRMEALSSEDFRLGWIDMQVNFARGNVEGTREAWAWTRSRIPRSLPFFAYLAATMELTNGDAQRARSIFLEAEPRWDQPGEWAQLLDTDPDNACLVAYAFQRSGSKDLGDALLRQAQAAFDALRLELEDTDAWNPQFCQLMAGESELALDTIEAQLSHGHLVWWPVFDRLPLYEAIRFEPRYQAALAERERRLAQQREVIAHMSPGAGS